MSNMRAQFAEWLNVQDKLNIHPSRVLSVLDQSSNYAQLRGIVKVSFWEISNPETFVKKYNQLARNQLFRALKPKTAQLLDMVFGYYRDFLSAQQSTIDTVSSDFKEKTLNQALYEKVYIALRELTQYREQGVSVLQIYEQIGGKLPEIKMILDHAPWAKNEGKKYIFNGCKSSQILNKDRSEPSNEFVDEMIVTLDFNGDCSLAFTKPVSLVYYDREYSNIKSWTDLYVRFISLIYDDYREKNSLFGNKNAGVSFSIKENGRIDLAYAEASKNMRAPKKLLVDGDVYLETNLSATNIVDKIRLVLETLRIPYERVIITYEKKSDFAIEKSLQDFRISREDTNVASYEKDFIDWMLKKGIAEPTVRSYVSAIHSAELFSKQNGIQGVYLTSSDISLVLSGIDILLSNKMFIEHNQKQHNRFSAAFRKLRDYISEIDRRESQRTSDTELEVRNPVLYHKLYSVSKVFDDPQGLTVDHILTMVGAICSKGELIEFLDRISWATKLSNELYTFATNISSAVVQPVVEEKEEDLEPGDFDKDSFIRVLMSRYQSGMQFDSIDLENFRDTYEDMYDEKLTFSDEELEVRLKYCGILYKDRLFPAEGIIDNGTKERLFAYIENKFAAGNKVLYYKAIFSDLADAFAYCFSLTDEQMLKAYIEHTAEKGKYYFHSNFMSTEKNVKIDHSAEIEDFMLAAGKPLSYEDVYEGLSHISKDIIYREIRIGSKFLMNEKEHYYHIDIFEFSETDGDKIAEILNKEIDENGYAIWSKVFDSVKEQMPIFIENNLYLSPLGIRNALSRFMAERFDFDGEVISTYGSHLGMADVFRLYAKHNAPFSDTDLYNFAKATDTTIYFWALAEESVRVSKTLFVAKDQIEFDVEATDKALETYLSSGYILVKDVDSFLVFPNVGYEWNEFLLESYLLHYSEKFCLVNNGISLNNVAGAVAKKDGKFTQFVDICAQALADSGIELKKAIALNYLADINLITRRSYKELDVAMTKARQIRNRKG